jgi:hypothetical protein
MGYIFLCFSAKEYSVSYPVMRITARDNLFFIENIENIENSRVPEETYDVSQSK